MNNWNDDKVFAGWTPLEVLRYAVVQSNYEGGLRQKVSLIEQCA